MEKDKTMNKKKTKKHLLLKNIAVNRTPLP